MSKRILVLAFAGLCFSFSGAAKDKPKQPEIPGCPI